MRKILNIFLLSLAFFVSFTINVFADSATITVDSVIPKGQDIKIKIDGKGFNNYLLQVGITGQEPKLQFETKADSCKKTSGGSLFTFSCSISITNPNEKAWTANITRSNNLADGTYEVRISTFSGDQGYIAKSTFTVGQPVAQPITLSISPSVINNDVDSNVTLIWKPKTPNTKFIVETGIPEYLALPGLVSCTDTCSTSFSVRRGVTPGVFEIRVIQDGDSSVRGSSILEIKGIIEKATPKPPATPPPPPCEKKGGLDAKSSPTTVAADIVSCSEIDTALGFIKTKPEEFVKSIFGIVLSLAGGVALVLIMISGYRLMFSQGNPEKVQAAREQLTSAIVGLLFVIFSVTILQIIGVDILHIPGFGK